MEVILTSSNTSENWSAAAWDPLTGSLLSTYKHAAPLGHRTLQVLSDCYVFAADATKPQLHIWPLNSQRPVTNLRLMTPGRVTALSSTPNGSYIVAAVGEKLYVWQTSNGRLLATIARHYQTITCLSFTKDASTFVSGGEDGLVFVWSLYRAINEEQTSPMHSFSNHTLPVKDLCVGHCGAPTRLYTVSLDRTASIYDLSSGTLLLTLVFDIPLTAVCINACETELFVGCTDGTVYKFDVRSPPRGIEHHMRSKTNDSNDETVIFRGHESSIVSLSTSVDCCTLLSAALDGKVHLWDIASRQILKTVNHKGQITAAFFAKRFENFRVNDLKPKLTVQPLQRVADDTQKDNFIEICNRGWNASSFLDFDSYVKEDSNQRDDSVTRKLEDAMAEIEKLKKINAAMYKYSVEHILNNTGNNSR